MTNTHHLHAVYNFFCAFYKTPAYTRKVVDYAAVQPNPEKCVFEKRIEKAREKESEGGE